MEIELTKDFLHHRLTDMSLANLPAHSRPCPHCGLQVRYPTIARDIDIEDFHKIMVIAEQVMKDHGITANLLAEITSRCHIEIAKQKPDNRQ